jgi:hypothetical protein
MVTSRISTGADKSLGLDHATTSSWVVSPCLFSWSYNEILCCLSISVSCCSCEAGLKSDNKSFKSAFTVAFNPSAYPNLNPPSGQSQVQVTLIVAVSVNSVLHLS